MAFLRMPTTTITIAPPMPPEATEEMIEPISRPDAAAAASAPPPPRMAPRI
jgi:hypothetical protein